MSAPIRGGRRLLAATCLAVLGVSPLATLPAAAQRVAAPATAPPAGPPSVAAPAPAPGPALSDRVPFDEAVRRGTLPNGLAYFVRQNGRPASRVVLRLAVKAGSLFEADDQQGLAHLIEHMAFNGSAHFKPGELVSYFERTGARLGPHVNAYTSFDETVYMLDLPADSAAVVQQGLFALADFAGGLDLAADQIDRERGVVVEEWRGRLGAGTRVRDQQLPVLYHQSRYAERLPIGKPEVLRTAPAQRLRDFYDTWYRPERMAVVVVGDVDPARIESGIREAFGPLASRAAAQQPPPSSVPFHTEQLVNITTDPEVTSSSVQVLRKRRHEPSVTVGDYRRSLVEGLFSRMMNQRFTELARRADAPFLGAGGGSTSLSPAVDAFGLNARVTDGRLPDGLTALETEAARVRQHGFTAPELARAKRSLLASYERAYNERDKNESASFAQEYLSYFLNGEPSPGIAYEYQLVQQLLPAISLADVTGLARERLQGAGDVVLAVMPQKDGVAVPQAADLRSALSAGARATVAAWNDAADERPLVAQPPAPGRVVSRREMPELGVTVVRLANGLEAWLKPTDFKNDQVLFTMYAPGGVAGAAPDDYLQASFAAQYVDLSGIGGIKALDLDKMLAGKRASAAPFISATTQGISGSSSPGELETALQLLYLTFTAPGDDPDAFGVMRRQLDAAVANRGRSPGQAFGEKLEDVNTSHHFTAAPLTPELLATLDRTRLRQEYAKRFANAADFTLFVVGAFKVDDVLPLFERWVGSLPSAGTRSAAFRDSGVRFPAGIERAQVVKGREPRSQTAVSFFADPGFDPVETERLLAATSILETVLRDALREDLGQTYTVSVGLAQTPPQRGDSYVSVNFGAAPENIAGMTDRVLKEVARLQAEGPSADLVQRAREGARRDFETAQKQNAWWMRRLQYVHMMRADPRDIITRQARIDSLSVDTVRETFRRYFPLDRYTVVTLMPEAPSR